MVKKVSRVWNCTTAVRRSGFVDAWMDFMGRKMVMLQYMIYWVCGARRHTKRQKTLERLSEIAHSSNQTKSKA